MSSEPVEFREASGRRERKKQATRQALHQAAWTLVEERGLANVTIEAITDRVDVAPRTFFNHYSSKEEAVLGSDAERIDRVCSGVAERLAAGAAPLDALHRTMREESMWQDLTSDQLRRRMQLMRDQPLLFSCAASQWEDLSRRLAAIIAAATGSDIDRDVYPHLVVQVAVVATRSSMMFWAEHPGLDLSTLIDGAIEAIRAGLPAPAVTTTQQPITRQPISRKQGAHQ